MKDAENKLIELQLKYENLESNHNLFVSLLIAIIISLVSSWITGVAFGLFLWFITDRFYSEKPFSKEHDK